MDAQRRSVQPFKKLQGYFPFHVYKQRMQPTVTSSYFLEVDLLAIILCADWAYSCLPLVRTNSGYLEAEGNENKLIGKLKVIIDISCGPFT